MTIEETKKYKAFYRQKKIVDYGTPGAFVQNKWSRQYYIVETKEQAIEFFKLDDIYYEFKLVPYSGKLPVRTTKSLPKQRKV